MDLFRKKKASPVVGSPEYMASRIMYLEKQIKLCREFSDFVGVAYKRGYKAEIVIVVDGQAATSGIMVGQGRREVLKYLAELSEGMRMMYQERLELRRRGQE